MPEPAYSLKNLPEDSAKVFARELHISPKKTMELCRELRGMYTEDAKRYLEAVIALRKAVPFKRYRRDVPHRKGKIMSGRYPVNAAKELLKLLEAVEKNAEYKHLDVESLKIIHLAAHRGRVREGRLPRAFGRATRFDMHTTNVELVVQAVERAEKAQKKGEKRE